MAGPIEFTRAEVSAYYEARVPHLKQRGPQWRGACPIHHGKNNSFAVDAATGRWFCYSKCGRGGDILDLEKELEGGDFPSRKAEVFRLVGRVEPEFRYNTRKNGHSTHTTPTKPESLRGKWRQVARYPYVDRDGSLLYEMVRYVKPDGKKVLIPFRPSGIAALGTTDSRRPGGVEAGGLVKGLNAGEYVLDARETDVNRKPTWRRRRDENDTGHDGVVYLFGNCPRVPYRLPKLLNAETVYLVEGEKDVHTLEKWGLVASCNPGGSDNSKLYAGWEAYFRGRDIVIIPDNDRPGRKHTAAVARILLSVAASLRIVELPAVPEKGDITDWRDAGGTFERFRELVEAAAPLDAAVVSELRARWGFADEEPHHQAGMEAAGSLAIRQLSGVEAKPVCWLWPGRIARGKLTIIAGNPGLGKSQITASIAAVVTTGGRWPVDRNSCTPQDVIFLNAEDDPADTLRPRLDAAGADLGRVHVVDGVIVGYAGDGNQGRRSFSLAEDLKALDTALSQFPDVALVVIDPITAYLGQTDSHKNAEVRGLLAPLSELAARRNTAVIAVSHLTKATGSQALMRVNGSLAFVAAARAAYLVTADAQDKARRLFLPMKNNLGPDAEGLAFRIEAATVPSPAGNLATSRVLWESGTVSMTADEAIQAEIGPQNVSAQVEAMEWLQGLLADEPMPASGVVAKAKMEGITIATLRRAARALSITKEKQSMKGGWLWSLPPKVLISTEGAQ